MPVTKYFAKVWSSPKQKEQIFFRVDPTTQRPLRVCIKYPSQNIPQVCNGIGTFYSGPSWGYLICDGTTCTYSSGSATEILAFPGVNYTASPNEAVALINCSDTSVWLTMYYSDSRYYGGSYEITTSQPAALIKTNESIIYSITSIKIYPLKWSYMTLGEVHSSPAIGSDGTIYVGSGDNRLYAINPDGTLKWSYATGDSIYSSPAIGSDGTIYVGSGDHSLYAINTNGTLKWSYATGNSVRSSPAIGSDGTIYVGSLDNKLYAIINN